MLVLDGHSSHLSLPFLQVCREHNIKVLCYPPHCTHALQGLDVVCFAKMKAEWRSALNNFYEVYKRGVNKEDFAEVFGKAYINSFTFETISAAFRATGVHPYNPQVISPLKLKPSEETSTTTTFPLPLASPVRRVMAVYHQQGPSRRGPETDPDTPHATHSESSLQSPSKHTLSDCIDPSQFTPTKRVRLMHTSLSESLTGSYLVAESPIDPFKPLIPPVIESVPATLPKPDFSALQNQQQIKELTREQLEEQVNSLTYNLALAKAHIQVQRGINEAANAQLIVQHLHAEKLQVALQEKAKKKTVKDRQSILFGDGKGRVVTSSEVVDELKKLEEELTKKEKDKADRQAVREARKVAKERLNQQWEVMKEAYQQAIEQWKLECARLSEQKTPKCHWPAKPKRPAKPRAPPIEHDRAASPSDGEDDSDDNE